MSVPEWLKPLLKPENLREIIELLKEMFSREQRILIVGSTGTGKTMLLRALKETMIPRMIDELNRTQFLKEEKIRLQKKMVKFIDTPGHRIDLNDHENPFPNPQLARAITHATEKSYKGIINIVSYGYHQYGGDPRPDFTRDDLETYLKDHRERELTGLKSWVPYMHQIGLRPFVMTIVTKADLWYGKQGVETYYQAGAYYHKLCELAHVPGDRLDHFVVIMSSRKQRFYGQIEPVGAWDDDARANARSNLIEQLLQAVGEKRG